MLQGKFRWKAILLLTVSFVVLGAGWFFLHRLQKTTIHGRFLEQAKRAEESTPPQYERAARFLRLYLLVRGDDLDAWVRYSQLLDEKLVNTPKAHVLNVYERILDLDKTNKDIQLRAAKLYIQVGRLDDAVRLLTILEEGDAVDYEVDLLLGEYKVLKTDTDKAVQQSRWNQAEEHFRKAISRAPKKMEGYARLAQLLRTAQKKPAEAERVLEDLIRVNETEHRAYLIRSAFRQSGSDNIVDLPALGARIIGVSDSLLGFGPLLSASVVITAKKERDLDAAGEDLAFARKLAPDHVDVLLASSVQEVLLARGKGEADPKGHFDKARSYLKRAGELYPTDTRILPQLAALELAADRRKEAIDILRTAQKEAIAKKERVRLLWDLGSLLIDEGITGEAEEVIGEMKKIGKEPYFLDFLRAKIAMKQSKWNEAIGLLESGRPLLLSVSPSMALQADLFLGNCFEQTGEEDQQLAVYQRAQKLDPLNPAARFGVAKALAARGRLDEAVVETQPLAGANLFYARLLILKNLRKPDGADWNEVSKVLKEAGARSPDVAVLQAEVAYAQATAAESQGKSLEAKGRTEAAKLRFAESKVKFAEAEKSLQEAKDEFPKSIEPWIAASMLAGRQGDADGIARALKILREAKAKFPDRAEARVAMLRYAPAKQEEALAFLRPLGENMNDLDRPNQVRLLLGLTEAFERAEDRSEAEKLWRTLVALEPLQLGIHLLAFDFYLRTENDAGMAQELTTIKAIQGADGPLSHFGDAQILIHQAGKRLKSLEKAKQPYTPEEKQLTAKEKQQTADARRHLLAAGAKRSRWARIPVSLAMIAEMEGNTDDAIKYMREAVELGNRQLPIFKALVSNLMKKSQYAAADEVLRKLQELDFSSDSYLQMRAAEISLFNKNIDQAFDLTQKAVSGDSKNFQDYLWQGIMLAKLDRKKEAEASLRTAIKLDGDNPAPWVVLAQLEARNDNAKKALEIIEEMKTRVSPTKLTFALAQCYQVIGQAEMAEKHYLKSLAEQPNDLEHRKIILQTIVMFYQNTGKSKEAEVRLRQILDPKLDPSEELQAWARRNLAIALGLQGNAEKQSEAMGLIEQNLKKNAESLEDQLVRGILLAGKPAERAEAIKILEKVFKAKPPSAEQMYILASLYETNNEWRKARTYTIDLLSTHANDDKYQVYLAAFIDKLMMHKEYTEAKLWIPRLTESIKYNRADPKRLATGTSLLTSLLRRHPSLAPSILAEIESTLQSSARKTGSNKNMLMLADFLGTSGDLNQTLDLCEQLFKDLPAQQVIAVAVSAVSNNNADAAQFKRAEALLKSARDKEPKLIEWDMQSAILKERQAEYAEAESLYRSVLKQEPNNIVALNNLAFLLGLRGKGSEANEMIDALIAKVGPAAELLDSRAAILCAHGKLADAEKDIRAALAEARTPYRLFHLAQILQAAGRTKDAVREFGEANGLGLQPKMLHPLEVVHYETLLKLSK